jgi:putative oxidoreductase
MNEIVNKFGPLVGRILIATIFLLSGFGKLTGFSGTAGYMAGKMPMSGTLIDLLLVITIIVELGGGIALVLGWKARLAALVFFLWLIPVTLLFHNFWAAPADQAMIQQIMFLKNLAIMGGMLLIMANGPGPYSVDKK